MWHSFHAAAGPVRQPRCSAPAPQRPTRSGLPAPPTSLRDGGAPPARPRTPAPLTSWPSSAGAARSPSAGPGSAAATVAAPPVPAVVPGPGETPGGGAAAGGSGEGRDEGRPRRVPSPLHPCGAAGQRRAGGELRAERGGGPGCSSADARALAPWRHHREACSQRSAGPAAVWPPILPLPWPYSRPCL